MSSAIDQIIDVKVSKGTATVAVASFTLPLVVAAFATAHTVPAFTRVRAYATVSGVDVTEEGKVASGEFIDIIIGIDWIQANLQATVFGALVSQGKLPYDDSGIQAVKSLVNGVLVQAAAMGILQADSIVVTVPKYADIPVADRNSRNLPDVKFTALLQGAVQTVQIRGTVSV